MRYVYQRSGGPLLQWKNGRVPNQSRAADTVSLGSLGDPTIAMPLPRPGAPEPIGGLGCGCGCGGSGACGGRRNDTVVIDVTSPSFVIGAAVGFFLLTKLFPRGA